MGIKKPKSILQIKNKNETQKWCNLLNSQIMKGEHSTKNPDFSYSLTLFHYSGSILYYIVCSHIINIFDDKGGNNIIWLFHNTDTLIFAVKIILIWAGKDVLIYVLT